MFSIYEFSYEITHRLKDHLFYTANFCQDDFAKCFYSNNSIDPFGRLHITNSFDDTTTLLHVTYYWLALMPRRIYCDLTAPILNFGLGFVFFDLFLSASALRLVFVLLCFSSASSVVASDGSLLAALADSRFSMSAFYLAFCSSRTTFSLAWKSSTGFCTTFRMVFLLLTSLLFIMVGLASSISSTDARDQVLPN